MNGSNSSVQSADRLAGARVTWSKSLPPEDLDDSEAGSSCFVATFPVPAYNGRVTHWSKPRTILIDLFFEDWPKVVGISHLEKTTEFEFSPSEKGTDPGTAVADRSTQADRQGQTRNIKFINDSDGSLNRESHDLLKERLRTAAILLFFGYLAFLCFEAFFAKSVASSLGKAVIGAHLAITVISGLIAIRMCMRCEYIEKHVRGAELVLFGGSTLFFALLTMHQVHLTMEQGLIRPAVEPWLILIFSYCLLIPNYWRRAAAVVIVIGVIPILTVCFAYLFANPAWKTPEIQADFWQVIMAVSLMMVLASSIGIWGVYMLRSLREEAFEARQLGQYRLRDRLGAGGMGEVYLAEHVMLKRPCAIKLIRPEKAGNPATLARFEREVRTTARLSHWNCVDVFDYGRAQDGTFYYVMEYLPGLSVQQLVDITGTIDCARIIYLMAQTCDALNEAHQQQFVHRDIKPANIFSAQRGGLFDVAKLLDFGLVVDGALSDEAHLTQEGAIQGSPLYLSPEQALGERTDERSDIYSLGAVMYFMLTGQPPFADPNPLKVILAHAKDAPRRPSELVDGVDPELENVIMRCLEKDKQLRFPDVLALKQALLDCPPAHGWNGDTAHQWWTCHGCPQKKLLDEHVLELAQLA